MLGDMHYQNYTLTQENDYEDDNVKIFHDIMAPDGQKFFLDFTPYDEIDFETFKNFVKFYEARGRMPDRSDINSCGPLHTQDLVNLVETL